MNPINSRILSRSQFCLESNGNYDNILRKSGRMFWKSPLLLLSFKIVPQGVLDGVESFSTIKKTIQTLQGLNFIENFTIQVKLWPGRQRWVV